MLTQTKSSGNGNTCTNGKRRKTQSDLPIANVEAERAVLGSLILRSDHIEPVLKILKAEDFHFDAHQKVFNACLYLRDRGHPVDTVLLADLLENRHQVVDLGPRKLAYLHDLIECAGTGMNAEYYAGVVRNNAIRRELDLLGKRIATDARDGIHSADELLKTARDSINGLARQSEEKLPILTCAKLLAGYPQRRPAIIEGLLREGETMNVIAPAKIGKSWLTLGLAFAIATGRPWLTFNTVPGRVLLIDNELHRETSADRLRTLARAMDVPTDQIADKIHMVNLRGRLQDLHSLGSSLREIERGHYRLVIIDAFYRTLPASTIENDNAAMAMLYNQIDCYADHIGAGFTLIHHASKGEQAAKAITDVGAGAGAQSRAADTHLVLRPHEEENAVVLDAAVRSWPPITPVCLRWEFPVWTPTSDLDPKALRSVGQRKRKTETEEEKRAETPWDAKRFATAVGKPEPRPRSMILDEGRRLGISSDRKVEYLLKAAIDRAYLYAWKEAGANSRTLIASVPPPDSVPEKSRRRR
jgi:hypothetical protein